ncbi:hypothetical protein F5Y05DRAFT_132654 [Hypoxylon sp. FL0543]|nr:hypothetical protein F5Y05DRAFT_132654 [Hypoxylon sp. FL0543]
MSLDSVMAEDEVGENSHNIERGSENQSSNSHKKRKMQTRENMIGHTDNVSLSSKRRKAAVHETSEHIDADINNVATTSPSSTEPVQIEDVEKAISNQLHRLHEVVIDHLDDNGTVYDRPNSPEILRRHRNARLMSGALTSNVPEVSHGTASLISPSSLSDIPLPGEETSEDSCNDSDSYYDDEDMEHGSVTGVLQNNGDDDNDNEGSEHQESGDGESGDEVGNKYTSVPYSPRKPGQLSSSVLTTPTLPTRPGKSPQQLTTFPEPVHFSGPRPQQYFDRTIPSITPTLPDPNGPANDSCKRDVEAAKGTSHTQDGKLRTPEDYSNQVSSKNSSPASEP